MSKHLGKRQRFPPLTILLSLFYPFNSQGNIPPVLPPNLFNRQQMCWIQLFKSLHHTETKRCLTCWYTVSWISPGSVSNPNAWFHRYELISIGLGTEEIKCGLHKLLNISLATPEPSARQTNGPVTSPCDRDEMHMIFRLGRHSHMQIYLA